MTRWPIPARTAERQREAGDPESSVWVSAHAGSGKTYVLAQRVVRLLLSGAAPSKILCLTFTKAAAANMAERVFAILSSWTTMGDADLAAALRAMGADASRLDRARRLFAAAVETPGGLKIQTIHAFCERLLHLFPFEANVPARFEVLTDEGQAELISAARERALAAAMDDERGELGVALRRVAEQTTSDSFDKLLDEALGKRKELAQAQRLPGGYEDALRAALNAPPGLDVAAIERDIVEGGVPPAEWPALARRLDAGSKNDQKAAAKLRAAHAAEGAQRLTLWRRVFFTKDRDEPIKSLCTAGLAKADPDLHAVLTAEQARLVALAETHKAVSAVERSVALVRLVGAVAEDYAALKQARGLLDFDDLIERACTLLGRSSAAWVLYKLDAGVDHVLVDEAQDTSADQWRILETITGEFFAGEGARERPRTLFVVGDEKQSIFSFQGAAPEKFGEKAREFQRLAGGAARPFRSVRLDTSFRSSPVVLRHVDQVFAPAAHHAGVVVPDEQWSGHNAWKADLPGVVELWRPIGPAAREAPTDWRAPIDQPLESDPPVALARRVAEAIARLTAPGAGEAVHDKSGAPRPARPGDVLILVRKRGPFFEAVIRALKERGVPVAGADRLQLAEHIAVMDLVAAGRAALLPQDDLTLACALKSPLIGLDDDDLLAIAPRRKGSLYDALRASPDERHKEAARRVAGWRARAGDSPFQFYARLLGPEGGRRAALPRLGPEAGDAVDEFLKLALDFEKLEPPSLAVFLHRMSSADISIKRDMESAGDAVRVMTVHAAKGLEAPIVFMPDTCGAASGGHDPELVEIEAGGTRLLAWRRNAAADPAPLRRALDDLRAREAAEHRRLLYVAMTRAEERLYVCGHHGARGPQPGCWMSMIETALADALEEAPAFWSPDETVRRVGAAARLADAPPPPAAPEASPAPDWLARRAAPERPVEPPVSPSSVLAAADRPDAPADRRPPPAGDALRRGSLAHALLQRLPDLASADRATAALRFLALRAPGWTEAERAALAAEALRVVEDARLAALFGPGSRAEVALAATVRAGGRDIPISGRIDRLCVTADAVLIADFKSGPPRGLDEVSDAQMAQLALYRAAARLLWPGRTVRAALVFTGGPALLEAPEERLDAALARLGA
ncbi:MAG TPA: double-strand break repair helicase AddA [Beijerinckiaceae bacterium]